MASLFVFLLFVKTQTVRQVFPALVFPSDTHEQTGQLAPAVSTVWECDRYSMFALETQSVPANLDHFPTFVDTIQHKIKNSVNYCCFSAVLHQCWHLKLLIVDPQRLWLINKYCNFIVSPSAIVLCIWKQACCTFYVLNFKTKDQRDNSSFLLVKKPHGYMVLDILYMSIF